MQVPSFAAKLLSILLAVLTPVLSLVIGVVDLPMDIATTKAVEQSLEKTDGFIAGICHPEPQYDMIKEANIGWIREDLPYPFDANGELTASYLSFKRELQDYKDNGINIMAITPYPYKYLEHGLDIRREEDIPEIQRIARFFVEDLKGIVGAFQVTNEMGVDRFTKPLTMQEAAKFIGVQLEAMYPIRGDILIGYNLGGVGVVELPFLMLKYNKYVDYVGVDLYFGCFENFVRDLETFPLILRFVHSIVRKPIILAEFGYIGYGEPKTAAEKKALLEAEYGVSSEDQARQNIDAFIEHMPPDLRDEFKELYADRSDAEKADLLFKGEYANHIYRELSEGTGLSGYPHTPEGQAKFYADLIPRLKKMGICIGAFIYMWDDSAHCYVCGQAECPVETGWGIVDGQGNKKPAFDAVKEAFAS